MKASPLEYDISSLVYFEVVLICRTYSSVPSFTGLRVALLRLSDRDFPRRRSLPTASKPKRSCAHDLSSLISNIAISVVLLNSDPESLGKQPQEPSEAPGSQVAAA